MSSEASFPGLQRWAPAHCMCSIIKFHVTGTAHALHTDEFWHVRRYDMMERWCDEGELSASTYAFMAINEFLWTAASLNGMNDVYQTWHNRMR